MKYINQESLPFNDYPLKECKQKFRQHLKKSSYLKVVVDNTKKFQNNDFKVVKFLTKSELEERNRTNENRKKKPTKKNSRENMPPPMLIPREPIDINFLKNNISVENFGKFSVKVSYNGIVVKQEIVDLNYYQPLWFYYGSVTTNYPHMVDEGSSEGLNLALKTFDFPQPSNCDEKLDRVLDSAKLGFILFYDVSTASLELKRCSQSRIYDGSNVKFERDEYKTLFSYSKLYSAQDLKVSLKIGQCCEYPALSVKLKSVIIKRIEELQSTNTDSSQSLFQSNANDNDNILNGMEVADRMTINDQY